MVVDARQLEVLPTRTVARRVGGEIARIVPGSPAERAGLLLGDWLLAVGGLAVRDLIDYSFDTAGEELALTVEREGQPRSIRVEKALDEDLGIEFVLPVFEGIRECNNQCEFCFIRGLPKGLRRSLYIRDDDYRYSFLFGTFVTLTNLDEADWQRIGFQKLTPLNVSVHATNLGVRRRMLANSAAPDILPQLDRLATLGIEVKAQVVLCPGQNDGQVLEQTIADLGARASSVVDSVAIVPVGLTRYSSTRGLRAATPEEARVIVDRASAWQRDFRRRLRRDFVYLSDELYLLAGRAFPPAGRYDGYRQLQNGIGLTRLLLDDWKRIRARAPAEVSPPRSVAWVCGRAAATALRAMAADLAALPGLRLSVVEVVNQLFGGGVTVSGLLAGRDVAEALEGSDCEVAILPRSAFGFEGNQTLDGWTPEAIGRSAGARIALGGTAAELLELTIGG